MTTFALNPAVSNVDYSVVVPAFELEKLGWDFNTNTDGLDIRLTFEGEKGKCFWAFAIDGADREDSGDDEKSLEDLLYLLSNEIVKYDKDDDYSTDVDGVYTPWITALNNLYF